MRAFVAIELSGEVRESLAALRERFRKTGAKASWVKTENLHLTLRFLGDVPEPDLARLGGLMENACAAYPPLRLAARGTGVFPNARRPNVLWVGLETLEGDLGALQSALEPTVRAVGLPPDKKRFHPHVTLARLKDHRRLGSLPDLLEETAAFDGGEFTAGAVSLFHSELTGGGAVYRKLREFLLQ